ncbi:MAG TPA: iron-siderophore ABC transporter substrate-binding protein [Acidimicrobiales bacterium]
MKRLLSLLLVALVGASACGGSGDDDTGEATPSAEGFPVTIEHKYGTTEIPAPPERVVSVGFNDQDTILALGTVPVGIRDWYGDQPDATWPWAHDLLDGAEPEVLPADELNVEAVAALDPDLIVGVSSGMTAEEYETLSAIAPTLAQSGDFIDYGMPWQDQTLMIGEALGRADEAEAMIAEVEDRYATIRADVPDLAGAEATVSYVMDESQIGAYGPEDARSRLLTDLGMVIPPEIADLAGDQFYSQFSREQIGLLDRDVLIWITSEPGIVEQIQADPLRQQLDAVAQGREIFLTDMESGAASFSSVLSLPYLLDTLVPKLAAAADGDPSTPVG